MISVKQSDFQIRSSRLRSSLLLATLIAAMAVAAEGAPPSGRLAGMVTDRQGNPMVDAEVLIVGPGITRRVERVLTDVHGRFAANNLAPGRYSIRVAAANLVHSGIEIEPGRSATLSLILGSLLPRTQPPSGRASSRSNDDWKWVLRTSAAVRPVLRYATDPSDHPQKLIDPSQKLVAMIPEDPGQDSFSDQANFGTVVAYWRPLTSGSDLLVATSAAEQGVSTSSLATSYRHGVGGADPQEITVVVHRLNFAGGAPVLATTGDLANLLDAAGVVLSYAQTRQVSSAIKFTSGFDVDYLDAARTALLAEPHAELEYQLDPASTVTVKYGYVNPASGGDSTVADQVAEMNAFPRVSLRGGAPKLEAARHSEAAYTRRVTKKTQVQIAAYHDGFSNAVVRGFGAAWGQWAPPGSVLPNATGDGVNLDGGNYGSSGLRASVSQSLGEHFEAGVIYSTGDALALVAAAENAGASSFASEVERRRARMTAAKLAARIPASKTEVVASYGWIERGSLTAVDPSGLAELGAAPFLGVEIRQPLPSISFLPGAHIEAVADLRNLTGEGYVHLRGTNPEDPLELTPTYRSYCGGFSVQF
jgi:Carboxypeptidase regulatory-like domain